jgi:hypothetical protein
VATDDGNGPIVDDAGAGTFGLDWALPPTPEEV